MNENLPIQHAIRFDNLLLQLKLPRFTRYNQLQKLPITSTHDGWQSECENNENDERMIRMMEECTCIEFLL
jgi:hypothetical protein